MKAGKEHRVPLPSVPARSCESWNRSLETQKCLCLSDRGEVHCPTWRCQMFSSEPRRRGPVHGFGPRSVTGPVMRLRFPQR